MFAPSNAAFSTVPQSTLNSLVSDKALLVVSVLKNDLLPGFAMTPSLRDGDIKTSHNGKDLTFKLLPNGVSFITLRIYVFWQMGYNINYIIIIIIESSFQIFFNILNSLLIQNVRLLIFERQYKYMFIR
jgi:hypothetical protein